MLGTLSREREIPAYTLLCPFPFLKGSLSFLPVAAPPNPNREVAGDTIIFRDTQISSRAVYQCNTSNEHGYLLANAFVSVLGESLPTDSGVFLGSSDVHVLCSLGMLGRPEEVWHMNGCLALHQAR